MKAKINKTDDVKRIPRDNRGLAGTCTIVPPSSQVKRLLSPSDHSSVEGWRVHQSGVEVTGWRGESCDGISVM
jgi:hypothetical protein